MWRRRRFDGQTDTRRADGHGAGKGADGCPVRDRFVAVAPRPLTPPLIPDSPVTSSDVLSQRRRAREEGRLRVALRATARSPWPSAFVVARTLVARVPTGWGPAERVGSFVGAFRTAAVLSVSAVVVSAVGAGHAPVRQAIAEATAVLVGVQETGIEAGSELDDPERSVGPASSVPVPTSGAASGPRPRAPRSRRVAVLRPLRGPVGLPVRGPVSSPFGPRVHPVSGRRSLHRGVDVAVPVGTPVRSTGAGRVVAVGTRSGYGLTVEVDHAGGVAVTTLYAHLDAVPADVRVGAVVGRGAVVGWSGGVGSRAGVSTGPHVHYEVRVRRSGRVRAVDPLPLLGPHVSIERWRWRAHVPGAAPRANRRGRSGSLPANVHLTSRSRVFCLDSLTGWDIPRRAGWPPEADQERSGALLKGLLGSGKRFEWPLSVGAAPHERRPLRCEPRDAVSALTGRGPRPFSSLILIERDTASSFNTL